jgi:hypothetical protein
VAIGRCRPRIRQIARMTRITKSYDVSGSLQVKTADRSDEAAGRVSAYRTADSGCRFARWPRWDERELWGGASGATGPGGCRVSVRWRLTHRIRRIGRISVWRTLAGGSLRFRSGGYWRIRSDGSDVSDGSASGALSQGSSNSPRTVSPRCRLCVRFSASSAHRRMGIAAADVSDPTDPTDRSDRMYRSAQS